MNQGFEQRPAKPDPENLEKVKHIAYQLWLARRDSNSSGDAERDYYQAERILESQKNQKLLLLGSFGLWAIAWRLGAPRKSITQTRSQLSSGLMNSRTSDRLACIAHKSLKSCERWLRQRNFRQHGEQFQVVFDALRQLLNPPEKSKPRIGFHAGRGKASNPQ